MTNTAVTTLAAGKKNLIENGHNKVKIKKNADMDSYIIRRGALQETY